MKVVVLFDKAALRPEAPPDEKGVLDAVEGVEKALRSLGHRVALLPAGGTCGTWQEQLRQESPDLAFNLCETLEGRSEGEAVAARALEDLGFPSTGSPSGTLELCRRKDRANERLAGLGFPVPPWRLWNVGSASSEWCRSWDRYPALVKPAAEDGSVGISQASVARCPLELERSLERSARWAPLLVQAFVGGRELQVGIVGSEILPVAEVDFSALPQGWHPIVDYRAKWAPGSVEDQGTRPLCPAPLSPSLALQAQDLAWKAWQALGGRGYGRVDLRLEEPDQLFLLEVNPNPDLAPQAGLARMARARGWDYRELIQKILEAAAEGSGPRARRASPAQGGRGGLSVAPLEPRHRQAIQDLLRATGFFRDDEVAVALEVLDAYFSHPGRDYSAVGAFTPAGEVLGFAVTGPSPLTLGTWDLYWIAVAPQEQGRGVGTLLLEEVEGMLRRHHARRIVVETSGRADYEGTRAFYRRRGYEEVGRVPDYYREGDDKVIYLKRLTVEPGRG